MWSFFFFFFLLPPPRCYARLFFLLRKRVLVRVLVHVLVRVLVTCTRSGGGGSGETSNKCSNKCSSRERSKKNKEKQSNERKKKRKKKIAPKKSVEAARAPRTRLRSVDSVWIVWAIRRWRSVPDSSNRHSAAWVSLGQSTSSAARWRSQSARPDMYAVSLAWESAGSSRTTDRLGTTPARTETT